MKAKLLDKSSLQNRSFTIEEHDYPYYLKMWHYHEELELILILESTGTRFIGDSIGNFSSGELFLVGKNLPHLWQNDDAYFEEGSGLRAKALVAHFKEDFLGKEFLQIPEMHGVRQFIERARRGVRFYGKSLNKAKEALHNLYKLKDFERIPALIHILNDLSQVNDYELLSSVGYVDSLKIGQETRLDKIYSFIYENFKNDITLDEVAGIANMNSSAFSRYFKRVNKKTFSQYLNEIRVGYACKMLIDNNYNIAQVCYASGYNNISNFNKQFKSITDMTPSEYLNRHNFN